MMKLIQVSVLTLLMLFGLSSCGGSMEPKQEQQFISKKESQNITSSTFSKVYKVDGSKQCSKAVGVRLDKMSSELSRASIDVVCSQKATDGNAHLNMCGADTGIINVYTIPKVSMIDAERLGFRNVFSLPNYQDSICNPMTINVPKPPVATLANVFKADGSLQCGKKQGVPLVDMALELSSASIDVIDARKTTDGLVRPSMCGSATGVINVYSIPSASVLDAKLLGFHVMPNVAL